MTTRRHLRRPLILAAVIPTLAVVHPVQLFSQATSAPIALFSKVILDVTRRHADAEWMEAKRGETLGSGDRVRTGERSIALIKFKDNSLLRVREQSEVVVTGGMSGSAFSKSVSVQRGATGFNIKKQRPEEEFRFTSPTSVASIRGTAGQFSAHPDGDTLIVLEGLVSLTNTLSARTVGVKAGFTGISAPDGSVETHPSTPEEVAAARSATQSGDRPEIFELELRDSKGGRKTLKIEFKEP